MLAAAGTLAPRATQAAEARIDVLLDEPIARIDPNVYGHFVEHLGGVVYDGIWVGEQSRIANTGGVRQALVERMRRLPKGVIRWPGGCFADSCDATIALRGRRAGAAQAVTLRATDIHAHNTFERPSDVTPAAPAAVTAGAGGTLTHRFPPASVARVTVALG